jgi:DNA invertase Pin-like site-specific DNA recombinase
LEDLSEVDSNKWAKLRGHVAKHNTGSEASPGSSVARDNDNLWRPLKQYQRRFSSKEKLAITRDHLAGTTARELAKKYGCHSTTMYRILKSHDAK